MNQLQRAEPYFNIHISGVSGYRADITECIDWGVTYEENADLTRHLSFTIGKHAETIVDRLHIEQHVTLSAGRFTKFKKIFVGVIRKITIQLPEDGVIKVAVECLSLSWVKLGKNLSLNQVYPDIKSSRNFANAKKNLKVSDIVRGIVAENDMQIGMLNGKEAIDIPKGGDKEYSLIEALHQKNISDWNLLRKLANRCQCTLWTEFEDDTEKLYFIDKTKVQENPSSYFIGGKETSFLYPLRTGETSNQFAIRSLSPEQLLIKEATVTVDVGEANAVSYSATNFNFETGEEVSLLSEMKEDPVTLKKQIVFYELDTDKVNRLDVENPILAERLRNMGMFDIPWSIARNFYKEFPKKLEEGENYVYDGAFFGITIDATVDGDIDIRSQRAYRVYGVPRYGSNLAVDRFWLYSLKHRFESDGFFTDLQFRR